MTKKIKILFRYFLSFTAAYRKKSFKKRQKKLKIAYRKKK